MKMRLAWSALAVAALALPAVAQNAPDDAVSEPPAASDASAGETIVLGELQNRMTVPVLVGEHGPYEFIVDTGAERSVISHELAQRLNLNTGSHARLVDFAGISAVSTVQVPSLSVSSLGTEAMEAPSLSRSTLGAAGMLGIDALQGHKIVIDFNRDRMKIKRSERHAHGEFVVEAERRVGQLIVTDAKFNDQPIAVIVDTGSWVSVGNMAMRALTAEPPQYLAPVRITSVTGRTFSADFVAVDNVRIGGMRFDDFGMVFADAPPFAQFGLADTPALILGMDALELFQRVEIDFANREIAFTLPRPPISFTSVCHRFANCVSYP